MNRIPEVGDVLIVLVGAIIYQEGDAEGPSHFTNCYREFPVVVKRVSEGGRGPTVRVYWAPRKSREQSAFVTDLEDPTPVEALSFAARREKRPRRRRR